VTGEKPFLSLLFIKFLYGTRILTIAYLTLKKIRFFTFAIFDAMGTIFWLAVMISIGWLAGKGVANVIPLYNEMLEYSILILVVLILIVKVISLWAKKRLIRE